MTQDELARSYLAKARVRVRVLEVLAEQGAWSDVVREAQELVELALKAMLRRIGIDPPKWHDVGPLLVEHAALLPEVLRADVPRLASISKWLRKEREFAFYGDVDFIPTDEYRQADADRAMDDANFVLARTEAIFAAPDA
ncbi:MAG TPA: HEPN domain-containing protein [Polyangiaceae bacterium]|nr:HEPN domain-containing protein [Polyangiaceae bacterium]